MSKQVTKLMSWVLEVGTPERIQTGFLPSEKN